MTDYEIARPNHTKVIDDLMDGSLSAEKVLDALLRWMPDAEIKECMEANEMWIEEEAE